MRHRGGPEPSAEQEQHGCAARGMVVNTCCGVPLACWPVPGSGRRQGRQGCGVRTHTHEERKAQ
eukprot:8660646-Alexandrium_andersonii.AAC.1